MKRKLVAGFSVLVSVMVVAWVINCGGGGSGGDSSDFSGIIKVLDLDERAEDIPLEAGKAWSLAFSVNLDMGKFGGPYTAFNLNFEDNLPALIFSTITTTGLAGVVPLGTETGYLNIYVGPVDAASPCAEGDSVVQYGPFAISFDDSDQPESVEPPTESATQDTIDIINIGAFSVCVEIDSPFDANATQGQATFTACNEEIIANMAGAWTGTYSCFNEGEGCDDDEIDVEISLAITQPIDSPGYAEYSDSEAFYSGNVCGYTFSFSGGVEGVYEENGLFVMDPTGLTATKDSRWADVDGPCSGRCTDILTRVVDD